MKRKTEGDYAQALSPVVSSGARVVINVSNTDRLSSEAESAVSLPFADSPRVSSSP